MGTEFDVLVGTKTVGCVQVLHSANTLLVERFGVGSFVEVQVSAKNLVATLSTQNHLDSHGLDLPAQQVHGRTRTNSGHIVCLEVVDDVGNGIQAFLNCEDVFVMHGAEVMGDFPCGEQVGRVLETDGEGV